MARQQRVGCTRAEPAGGRASPAKPARGPFPPLHQGSKQTTYSGIQCARARTWTRTGRRVGSTLRRPASHSLTQCTAVHHQASESAPVSHRFAPSIVPPKSAQGSTHRRRRVGHPPRGMVASRAQRDMPRRPATRALCCRFTQPRDHGANTRGPEASQPRRAAADATWLAEAQNNCLLAKLYTVRSQKIPVPP